MLMQSLYVPQYFTMKKFPLKGGVSLSPVCAGAEKFQISKEPLDHKVAFTGLWCINLPAAPR